MSPRKQRILLLGDEPSDFTGDISQRSREAGLLVDVLELRGLPIARRSLYDEVLEPPPLAFRSYQALSVLRASLSTQVGSRALQAWRDQQTFPQWVAQMKEAARSSLISRWAVETLRKYDLVNFQYITPGALRYVPFVPTDVKVVLSYWGDDLLHGSPRSALEQLPAVERADVITLHSPEMREIFLSKFGRQFEAKVRTVLFGVSERLVTAIDNCDKASAVRRFRSLHQIERGETIVAIGYNGSPRHNHLQIIEKLATLSSEIKEGLVLLMPMTYACTRPDYPAETLRLAESAGLRAIMPRKFLGPSELVDLRIASDIMILVPESDAMSSSLVESLWAGSMSIVASWLPYGLLRAANIHMREVSSFEQIPDALRSILTDLPEHKTKASKNRSHLDFMKSTMQADQWTAIYRSALDH